MYRQREERLSKHAGTCEWIFEHPKFVEWCRVDTFSPENSALFIVGPSGCGKSVLANHIANTLTHHYEFSSDARQSSPPVLKYSTSKIDQLNSLRPKITILRFFCRDARSSTLDTSIKAPVDAGMIPRATTPIVEAFLYQILDQCRQLFRSVSTFVSRQSSTFGPGEIQTMFRQVLASQESGHIILLIDGLDECDDAFTTELLEYFDLLIQDTLTRTESDSSNLFKLLFTCQPVGSIPFWSCRYSSIHIQLQDLSQDIHRYVRDEVHDIARSRNLDADLQNLTENLLVELAGRMFLWAYFIIQELRHISVISTSTITSTIMSFPRDLDRYYSRTLERIVRGPSNHLPREQNSAMILLITVFSLHDLNLKEISEVLAIAEQRESRDKMVDFINTDIRTLVETQLAPLVAVDGELVVVSHYSIYEYLEKIRPTKLRVDGIDIAFNPDDINGHIIMAELCLRYLLLDDFARLPRSYVGRSKVLDKRFPFLNYASTAWFLHVKRAGNDLERILPLIRIFLDTKSAKYQLWDRLYYAIYESNTIGPPTPVLHTLVGLDLWSLYEVLYETGSKSGLALGAFGSWQKWFYEWCSNDPRFDEPVSISENINERNRRGSSALHVAVIRGHNHWLQPLMHMGADPFARTASGWSALHLASTDPSSIACAETLLKCGHGVEISNSRREDSSYFTLTPLCFAAESGNIKASSLLLQYNANIDPDVPEEERPLFLAAKYGHYDAVLHLLKHQPELILRAEDGNTLLHWAAYHGMTAFAECLISELDNFDVDQRNRERRRPLQIAAINGHPEMIKTLLNYGARIEAENDIYHQSSSHDATKRASNIPPLALAVQSDQTSSALLLLDKGARWQLDSWSDWTLLHEASKARNLQILKILQERGMDIDQATSTGQTPLFLATINQDLSMVTYILSLNPDLDSPIVDTLITPLHMAAYLGASAIANILLQQGADIGVKNKHGLSVLCAAALSCKRDVLETIISYSPDLDSPDNDGETPLFYSVQKRAIDCVSLLLGAGASTSSPAKSWGQPLHKAVTQGDINIMCLLLDANADINARSRSGYNSLMIACQKGDEEIMEELLRRGADLDDCVTVDGMGLFHLAAMSGKRTILEKVVQLKGTADIDRPSSKGETPFLLACRDARIDLMQALLASGANPYRLSTSGENAIHYAAFSGDLAKIRYLLNLQVPFAMRSENGESPLDYSCEVGHVNIAKALIKEGADFRYVNKYTGETCLHRGARFGRDDIVSLLIAKGADLESRDHLSLTPLLRAIIHFRRTATKLLVAAGANIDACDSLGRTAFSLVMQQYHTMAEDVASDLPSSALCHAILKNIELARGNDEITKLNAGRLARNLLRFQDNSNALRAFFMRLELPDPSHIPIDDVTEHTTLIHEAICDHCQDQRNIVGMRYKCLTCEDLDLCSSCMKRYKDSGPSVCKNHTFFEVPGTCPYLATMVFEKEKFRTETLAWLDELHSKYSAMECSSLEASESRSMIDMGPPVVAMWVLHHCGLNFLNIRTIWALRRAASSVPFMEVPRADVSSTDFYFSQD